jgi:hypothetical protein
VFLFVWNKATATPPPSAHPRLHCTRIVDSNINDNVIVAVVVNIIVLVVTVHAS